MTGARPLTYGQLLDEALLELNQALSGTVRFDRDSEAVTAAQARTRIYSVVARAADSCAAGLGGAAANPASELSDSERRTAARLHDDLAASAAVTGPVLDLPRIPSAERSIAGRLARAAVAAGLAWDLLASRLPPDRATDTPAPALVSAPDARAVLADAALLARGMAILDVRLEPAMAMAAVDPATPAALGRLLRQVAEDCDAVTLLGVRSYTADILRQVAEPSIGDSRPTLDALTLPPAPLRVTRLTSAEQAIAAAEGYLNWLVRRGRELTVPDLASLAATASRVARLAARPAADNSPAHPAGGDAVLAWRQAYEALRPLRTVHHRPTGWGQAFRLAAWADQQLREPPPPSRGWQAGTTAIAGLLPALADAGHASLRHLHSSRQLYAPIAHGHRPYATADGPRTRRAVQAFAAARRASAALAQPPPAAAPPEATTPGNPPAPSTPDDTAPAHGTVRIGTPSGTWELGWDPAAGAFYARHHTADTAAAGTWLGSEPAAVPSTGELEQQLGFPLPADVRGHLHADQQARPPRTARALRLLQTGDGPPGPPASARPTPDSPVHLPGRPPTTYRQALQAAPPLRVWEQDGYRVEILTADPYPDPDTGTTRNTVTYRLSQHGRVVFSGDDIDCPGHHDPAADDAVRAVVDLLTRPNAPSVTPTQRAFLDTDAAGLAALVRAPEPPYPPGTRIAVTAPGRPATTGVVAEPITDADGNPTAYAWRPDTADLPGHPWHGRPQHTLVSPPEQVTPTLAAPDLGLAGWTPDRPLGYRTRVEVLDPDGEHRPGQVLRAVRSDNGLGYDIRPDPPAEPERLPASRVEPVAGTAWPSIGHLIDARAADGVPLQADEILAAGAELAYVVAGANGVQVLRARPGAHTPAAPAPEPAPEPAWATPAAPAGPAPLQTVDLEAAL